MRAGSLMFGCSFDVTCFKFTLNVGADSVKFGAPNVSFGMLGAPNLALWGPSSDAGGHGSTQKETLGVQAWISIEFGRISGPPFGRFWPTLGQQLCFLACVFAGHVFERFGGLNLDVWVSRIKHLVWKVMQKTAFHICRDYVDFGVIF